MRGASGVSQSCQPMPRPCPTPQRAQEGRPAFITTLLNGRVLQCRVSLSQFREASAISLEFLPPLIEEKDVNDIFSTLTQSPTHLTSMCAVSTFSSARPPPYAHRSRARRQGGRDGGTEEGRGRRQLQKATEDSSPALARSPSRLLLLTSTAPEARARVSGSCSSAPSALRSF